jgi:hypothetical protein
MDAPEGSRKRKAPSKSASSANKEAEKPPKRRAPAKTGAKGKGKGGKGTGTSADTTEWPEYFQSVRLLLVTVIWLTLIIRVPVAAQGEDMRWWQAELSLRLSCY